MLSGNPRMSCWHTLQASSFLWALLTPHLWHWTELKWQTHKNKAFLFSRNCRAVPQEHGFPGMLLDGFILLLTWLIVELMFILLAVVNFDLWFHVGSRRCWNRVEQPPVPACLLQSLLLWNVGRAGFVADVNHNMEEELMPGRERAQAVRAAVAAEGMHPEQEL